MGHSRSLCQNPTIATFFSAERWLAERRGDHSRRDEALYSPSALAGLSHERWYHYNPSRRTFHASSTNSMSVMVLFETLPLASNASVCSAERACTIDRVSFLGDAKSSLGDAKSLLGDVIGRCEYEDHGS